MKPFDFDRMPILADKECCIIGIDEKEKFIWYATNNFGKLSFKKEKLEEKNVNDR